MLHNPRSVIRPFVAGSSLVAILLCWSPVLSQDWPGFRGPTGQGVAAVRNLPLTWSATENVSWKTALPGEGWSSPSLYKERIYVTAAVPVEEGSSDDLSLRALCLDAGTGKLLWNVEVFLQDGATAPNIHRKNSHASPSPLVDGTRLYVHFGHQGIACLDLAGRVVWRNADLTYRPVHGNGGSPALVDDKLIFSTDGARVRQVVALDRNTGRVVWRTDRPGDPKKKFSFSTPLVIEVGGKKQIISPASDVVGAYDPRTGKEIWRVRYDGYSVIPRPVYGHGLLYLSTGYDSPKLLAIRPDGQGDVTDSHVAWTLSRGAPHTPSPLLVGDELYVVSDRGIASCLDARSGRVHWQERVGGNYSASPLYGAGRIYLQSEQGEAVVIKPGREFVKLAENTLGEPALASYAATDSALIIRTAGYLWRIHGR